ncbi:MAG: methyltransferase domain-containing protein [Rickettsiaceae bacterium]|nr:MAG: methyltransferase domain-containing protein [Rickettsiaceae bacterium]
MNLNNKLSNPLQCPVCRSSLIKSLTSYYCSHNHHFDQSKNGYTNLLLANQKRSSSPGDSKEMVQARFNFLRKGYYQPIAQAISDYLQEQVICSSYTPLTLIDIGCGVGYYLDFIKQNYPQTIQLCGIDISKKAIKKAASAYQDSAHWSVGSMKDLPFMTQSVEVVLSVFAPLQTSEIVRILNNNGFLLTVTPAIDHLIEYRIQLFDQIKTIDNHKIEDKLKKDFALLKHLPIRYQIQLEQEDISDLLKMTPYYWKSYSQRQQTLLSLPQMTVTVDVIVCLFQKKLSSSNFSN